MLPFTLGTPPLILMPANAESGIEDGRGRFRQILSAVSADHGRDLGDYRDFDDILWRMAGEDDEPDRPVYLGPPRLPLRILVVGGLASECSANYVPTLSVAMKHLTNLGYEASELTVAGLASSTYNGYLIAEQIRDLDLKPGERVVLVGHSKGLPDILEGVAVLPDAARRVAAVVGLAGAVNGSPLVETAPTELFPIVRYLPNSTCRLGDGQGLDSLRRDRRMGWLASHPLPAGIRYYSLAAFVDRDQTSLALRDSWERLSRIDPRNDGQLLFYDQIIPGSTLLGFVAADHWAVAMPLNRIYPNLSVAFANHGAFPREVVLEAIVRYIEEDLLAGEAQQTPVTGNPTGTTLRPRANRRSAMPASSGPAQAR
ncbi:MAG: hypothetical protein JNM75_15590 [Rhodospirillales bacterium]|nr:hypothetical protein [Rhodospirillales bacterium]